MSKAVPRTGWDRHIRSSVLHIGRMCNTLKRASFRDWWVERSVPIMASGIQYNRDYYPHKIRRLRSIKRESIKILLRYKGM